MSQFVCYNVPTVDIFTYDYLYFQGKLFQMPAIIALCPTVILQYRKHFFILHVLICDSFQIKSHLAVIWLFTSHKNVIVLTILGKVSAILYFAT